MSLKRFGYLLFVLSLLFTMVHLTVQASEIPEPSISSEWTIGDEGFVIDHTSVVLFDQIPLEYLQAAQNLHVVFKDRSVGSNINDGLSCLAATSWESSPAHCRRDYIDDDYREWKTYTSRDSSIPAEIYFSGGVNRDNIEFLMGMGSWEEDLQFFIQNYENYADRDVFTFQHNYLHVAEGSSIDDYYFDPDYDGLNIYDLIDLEAQYPQKDFVYWTSSLARTIGTADAQSFNDQMRTWAVVNGKILFDVADIESHTPQGERCQNQAGYDVICKRYTTEVEGGHLGSVSAGKIRIAKAMWVLLARLSGWNPVGEVVLPTQTPVLTQTATPTLIPTETVVPSPTLIPTQQPTSQPTVVIPPDNRVIIINHESIYLYDQIPPQYLDDAERLKFTFMDRSVGSNINDGLTCLSYPAWVSSPAHCRRDYTDASLLNWKTYTVNDSEIPDSIYFPGGNDRGNIEFLVGMGTWEEDLTAFINLYPNYTNRDIFTFQHNYLHVAEGSTIDEVYFDPAYPGTNIYDLLALENQYSDHVFVYWTTSLARTVGTQDAQSFNDQMRSWTFENQKILLDVADIESHAPDGSPCVNENGYEVICREYTTETEGGHLGSVSAGKIRIAKAIWVMLAQIAGWQP